MNRKKYEYELGHKFVANTDISIMRYALEQYYYFGKLLAKHSYKWFKNHYHTCNETDEDGIIEFDFFSLCGRFVFSAFFDHNKKGKGEIGTWIYDIDDCSSNTYDEYEQCINDYEYYMGDYK